jgi:hypothetical protein
MDFKIYSIGRSLIKVSSPDGPSMRAKKQKKKGIYLGPRAVSRYRGVAAAVVGAVGELPVF